LVHLINSIFVSEAFAIKEPLKSSDSLGSPD
jgi:hypothetical protein